MPFIISWGTVKKSNIIQLTPLNPNVLLAREDFNENDSVEEDDNDKREVEGGVKESEETGEEGVSGEKLNDNGTDIDNKNSDEETKKRRRIRRLRQRRMSKGG